MKKILALASVMLLAASLSYGQLTPQPNTNLTLTVGAEAIIQVGATSAFSTSTAFAPYTASTSYSYFIRTSASTGSGYIQLKVTSDFGPTGGPSVTTPPTSGDALTYTNTVSSPGAAVSGMQTASTSAETGVATFGAGAYSPIAGTSGNTVSWSLTNDPKYAPNSYSATVTFTISAS